MTAGGKKKMWIGILTDTAPLAQMLAKSLDAEKFDPIVFESSDEKLIEKIAGLGLSMLFLRTELKDRNGLDVCRELKEKQLRKELPIVFLSNSEDVAARALEYRADAFLKIPFEKSAVTRVVGEYARDTKNLLFVDDSEIMHKAVVPELKRAGFEIMEGYNGAEGLELLQHGGEFDLVISDIEMPTMDGYAFCAAAKGDPRFQDVPFIICSSLDSEESIEKGFAAGANDYLIKPFVIPELIGRIREHLRDSSESRPEKILVVEADAITRSVIVQALRYNGFDPEEARNGRVALSHLRRQHFNLMIASYELPFINGRELALQIRTDDKLAELPMLMMHARESRTEMIRMRSAGIQAFLPKPFTGDRLLAEVERILAQSRLEQERHIMRHYLADEAARAIESGRVGDEVVEVENAFRTILFTDIAKFTPLCERLSPHEVVELLNRYFDVMVGILIKYGARIDKFIGDAIMALFPGQEDGAHRAVCAGVEMVNAVRLLARDLDKDLHMRVGINSGHVIMGDIGSRLYRRDFTVIGDNVNTAQRLESNAEIDGVLISGSTYKLLEGKVVADSRELQLKGKKDLFTGYQVRKVKPFRGELTEVQEQEGRAAVLADNK